MQQCVLCVFQTLTTEARCKPKPVYVGFVVDK